MAFGRQGIEVASPLQHDSRRHLSRERAGAGREVETGAQGQGQWRAPRGGLEAHADAIEGVRLEGCFPMRWAGRIVRTTWRPRSGRGASATRILKALSNIARAAAVKSSPEPEHTERPPGCFFSRSSLILLLITYHRGCKHASRREWCPEGVAAGWFYQGMWGGFGGVVAAVVAGAWQGGGGGGRGGGRGELEGSVAGRSAGDPSVVVEPREGWSIEA